MTHLLDFQSLPVIKHGRAFIQLDLDVALGIETLRRLKQRADNAVRFAHWSTGTSETLGCPETELQQLREGCFRAALTEFSSMEEVQTLDYEEIGIVKKPLKLNDTASPLLHLFRELRNLEVHLRHSELQSIQKDVFWGHVDHPEEAIPLTISIWILEGVTPKNFSRLRNAKRYTGEQIEAMTSWLNASQQKWGVQELFVLAVEEYCKLIKFRVLSR